MAKKKKESEVLTFEDKATNETEEVVAETSEEIPSEEPTTETEEPTLETKSSPTEEPSSAEEAPSESNTVDIVYLGISEKATVVGKVTGTKYTFLKDMYGMPTSIPVDEQDSSAILSLRGKACCGSDPNRLFATKTDWDVELAQAKKANQ